MFTLSHHDSGPLRTLIPVIAILALTASAFLLSPLVPSDYQLLVILAPLALAAGFVILMRPELALYLSIGYIPFESSAFRPIDLPGGLSIAKVLGAVLIATVVFNILFRRHPFRLLDDSEDLTILLLAACLLFSGAASEYPDASLHATIRMIRIFAFYFAVKNLVTSRANVRTLMWIIFTGGTYAALWGLNSFFELRAIRDHDPRIGGILMDPNEYAIYALFVLMIGLYLLPMTRSRILKALVLLGALGNVAAIVLSASRGGILTLSVVAALYILSHPRRWQILFVTLLIGVISFPFWPDGVRGRLGLGTSISDDIYSQTADYSAQRRVGYLQFSTVLIEQAPLMGVGYGTFASYYPRSEFALFDNPLTENGFARLAHNTYLEITVGAGLLGLTVYLAYLAVVLRDLFLTARRSRDDILIASACRALLFSLIGFIIASLFLSIEHFNFLWMAGGMASALRYLSRQPSPVESAVVS